MRKHPLSSLISPVMSNVTGKSNAGSENREALVITDCHIDPEVTKTSIKISEAIEDSKKANMPTPAQVRDILEQEQNQRKTEKKKPISQGNIKQIKPVGEKRVEKKILESEIVEMDGADIEKEALTVGLIDSDTMQRVKEIARSNPLTKDLIEKGKQFFHDNRELVIKQTQDLVALYNIKDKKPFFFISPSEARMAIDYVKGIRNGLIQDKAEEVAKDQWVRDFLSKIKLSGEKLKIVKDAEEKLKDEIHDFGHLAKIASMVDDNIKLKDRILDDLLRNRVRDCYYYVYPSMTRELSLSWMNHIFAVVECLDTGVDTLIMSASMFADVRNWGHTVYDEATYREIKERGVFGHLLTADIYVSSKIPQNQVITGSSRDKLFICNNNGW